MSAMVGVASIMFYVLPERVIAHAKRAAVHALKWMKGLEVCQPKARLPLACSHAACMQKAFWPDNT